MQCLRPYCHGGWQEQIFIPEKASPEKGVLFQNQKVSLWFGKGFPFTVFIAELQTIF